jgi:hypothetical protein
MCVCVGSSLLDRLLAGSDDGIVIFYRGSVTIIASWSIDSEENADF